MAKNRKPRKRDIENHAHTGKERVNNPPVGLVTPETDKDAAQKTYQHDPHVDPQLSWAGEVAVSTISFWEVALLCAKRRIALPQEMGTWRRRLVRDGLKEVSVDGEIGLRAAQLVDFQADPADRLVVATALGGHPLVTADQRMLDWPGPLWRLRADE